MADTLEAIDHSRDGPNREVSGISTTIDSNHDDEKISLKTSWRSLFRFTTIFHIPLLLLALPITVAAGVIRIVFALYLGKLFQVLSQFGTGAINGHQLMEQTRDNTFILLIIGAATWLASTCFFFVWIVFGELQVRGASRLLFGRLLARDLMWFDMRKDGVGSFLSHSQKQLRELQIATAQPLGLVIMHVIRILTGIILAFVISWRVTLVTMAGIPVTFAVIIFTSSRMSPILKAQQSELSEASKITYDAFKSIDVVKCLNGQASTYTQMMARIRAAARLYMRLAILSSVQAAFPRFMSSAMFVQGFWYGSVLVRSGRLEPGDVLTTFWACMTVTQSMGQLVQHSATLERGKIAGETLHQYIRAEVTNDSTLKIQRDRYPNLHTEDIVLKDVVFSYPSRSETPVLNGLNIRFPAGRTTFIVGHSGAGKSTLINLLLQFYSPTSGGIIIGDTPFQAAKTSWVRQNITFVQQNSYLFNESLWDNIAFGSHNPRSVSNDQMEMCIEMANLQGTIRTLPNQLNTLVGLGGNLLSGGQKQRVAIARARMKNSAVLILDEFTSALDYDNRATVMESVRKWRQGMTTIIVTHDTANILDDDFVYVLEAGQVAASGLKRDLLRGDQRAIFAKAITDPISPQRSLDEDILEVRCLSEQSWLDDASVDTWFASFESSDTMETPSTALIDRSFDKDIQFSPSAQTSLRELWPIARKPDPVNNRLSMADGGKHRPSRLRTFLSRRHGYNQVPTEDTGITTTLPLQKTLLTIPKILNLRQRVLLAIAAILATLHAASTPVFSYLLSKLFTSYYVADRHHASSIAKTYSILIVTVALVDAFVLSTMLYLLEYCSQAWMDKLRGRAMQRVLAQPCSWFEQEGHGPLQLTICLDQHAEEIRNLAGKFGSFLIICIMTAVIAIIWSFSLKWQLTFVSLSCGPVWYGMSKGLELVNTRWERSSNDLNVGMGSIFSEAFTDIATVRAFTLENHFTGKLSNLLSRRLGVSFKRGFSTGLFFGLVESVIIFASALLIYYAAVLAAPDAMGITNILSVLTMILFSLGYAASVISWIPQVNSANDTATRLIRLSQLRDGSSSHENSGKLRVFQPVPVEFHNLSFRYPSRPEASILTDFSVKIPENSCSAIVGSSGSGKSTVISLLLGLYACPDPSPGQELIAPLTLGGVDIRQLHMPTLRSMIGYVPQQPKLFADTIRANITYGLDPYSRFNSLKNIETAAVSAGIADFIYSLPEGYSTLIGEGGLTLSGGQAQRLVIARALVRHPRILILDEATSNLDAESAEIIRRSVRKLLATPGQGLTVIMVTHSRDMMEMADNVIVVDKGMVVEQGSFMGLMKRVNGRLRQMLDVD
ncbi:ABC a-pheromone efflux pump AtrD [Talaromyces stipitatus ATCC 10500]|uniref:ABC a-pheromone efflux pump AtrD n=1 Tax=Talaromyces stipitatus (strain ATCC 10500 / CBS 375.48 / QM 6759 / NRRL 1006) TaxID=441959 RepID=B8ME52_TALSN|nr:ABC a-pheromone efflux pump AtrD [Talaromyces stipitatus ATCC 10500]EED16479.1 ABC a-pheromone efflux pump AtrD [Talaromyces stipitatus ATCC 10500]